MQSCTIDADCGRLNHCDFENEECVHNDLFDFKGLDLAAYLLMGLFLGLQNIGGLGAGTIKIFVFMMMLNYSMKESTAYTYPVLLGSKLADNLMALSRKHPIFKDKPLIDYSIVLIFLPAVLLGSAMGSGFSPILPNIVLQFTLFLFVGLSFYATVKKVKKQWEMKQQAKKQQQEQENKEEVEEQKNNENQNNNNNDKVTEQQDKISSSSASNNNENKKEVPTVASIQNFQQEITEPANKEPKSEVKVESEKSIEEKQKQQEQNVEIPIKPDESILKKYQSIIKNDYRIPLNKLSYTIIIFCLLFVYYFILGGKKADSPIGIEMCSTSYWVMWGLQFTVYAALLVIIIKFLRKQESIKIAAQHVYKPYETNFAKLGIRRFIVNGFGCGFITGLVGFGGSLSIVPVMVMLGLHPRAATASTSFLTIFASGMSVIIALLGGQVELDAFGFLFGVSFASSLIFTYILNKIVDYFKLDSFTIAFTAVVQFSLLAACVALFIVSLIKQPFDDQLKTRDFC